MWTSPRTPEHGNALLCILCTIAVVSMVGGNILLNCITRYNTSSSQVRGWMDALYAAEAGGDIAYAEIRKTILDRTHAFSGWTSSGISYSNSVPAFGRDSLVASSTVDAFYSDFNGNAWYRVRAKGTAPILGVKRVTMDDRMGVGTRGDSLLRKIDFNYDHFTATYGPNGDGSGKAVVPVAQAQMSRRIELIAAPVTPFEAAVRALTVFNGPGSAGMIDSFNSSNGPYYFCADNPADPHYADSHSGGVQVNSTNFNLGGAIWGDVSTNGGNVKPTSNIHGTIDNNVPFTVLPYTLPTDLPTASPNLTTILGNVTLTPPVSGNAKNPNFYVVSSFSGNLTINPVGTGVTYVAIHVTNDITGTIDVKPGVHAEIFFDGNINLKARDIVNETGIAGNLQFYGISPVNASTSQSINIAPPGNLAATFYAPSADFYLNGNPDVVGAVVCKTFYGNGNTSLHYDRALSSEGEAVDYRIASYVEDIR
jgi:hypothetical protein